MAGETKISEFEAVATLDGSELLEVVQSGVNKKATINDLNILYLELVNITDALIMGKQLTGVAITGNTIANGDTLISALCKLQNQVNKPIASTGVVIAFDTPRVYGTYTSPETGAAITVTAGSDFVEQTLIHTRNPAPSFPGTFVLISGAYNTAKTNFIKIRQMNSTKFHYTIYTE